MMHVFPARLTGTVDLAAVERTVFRADGSRTVTGPLGTVTYDAEGNATFAAYVGPREGDVTRWDLAA